METLSTRADGGQPSADPGAGQGGRTVHLVRVAPEAVARMQRDLEGHTHALLTSRFGISYNTWRKLVAGRPVRASVAQRLLARLSALDRPG